MQIALVAVVGMAVILGANSYPLLGPLIPHPFVGHLGFPPAGLLHGSFLNPGLVYNQNLQHQLQRQQQQQQQQQLYPDQVNTYTKYRPAGTSNVVVETVPSGQTRVHQTGYADTNDLLINSNVAIVDEQGNIVDTQALVNAGLFPNSLSNFGSNQNYLLQQ